MKRQTLYVRFSIALLVAILPLLLGGGALAAPLTLTVSSVSPSYGTNDGSVDVTITGEGFEPAAITKSVELKRGAETITVTNLVVVDTTQLTCTFNLVNATVGSWDVVVTFDSTSDTLVDGFDVTYPAPTLDTVEPSTVINDVSTTITLIGGGFVDTPVVRLVGAGVLEVTYVSSTVLTAVVPVGIAPGTYALSVTNPGPGSSPESTLENTLTVLAPTPTPTATAAPTPTSIPPPTPLPTPTSLPTATPFQRPLLFIDRYSYQPQALVAGSSFELTVELANAGNSEAKNIQITFLSGPFLPESTSSAEIIFTLPSAQRGLVTQSLRVSDDLEEGTYEQAIRLEYDDPNGVHYSSEESVGITVLGRPTHRPFPIIISYRSDPENLEPGDTFTLSFQIQNLGGWLARDLTVSFGGGLIPAGGDEGAPGTGPSPLGPFAPLGSSNVQFIGTLEPDAVRTVTQRMIIDGSATSAAYTLPVTLDYDDQDDNHYTSSELISLLVIRQPRLVIDLYRPVAEVMVGESFTIPVEVINVSRFRVNVTTMELTSEDLSISEGSLYIGPLDSGTSGTLEASAVASEAGKAMVLVRVNYLDDFEREGEVTEEFHFTVLEPPPVQVETPPVQPGQNLWQLILRFLKALFGLGG